MDLVDDVRLDSGSGRDAAVMSGAGATIEAWGSDLTNVHGGSGASKSVHGHRAEGQPVQ